MGEATAPIEFSYSTYPGLGKLAASRFILRHAGVQLTVFTGVALGCTIALCFGYQYWYVIVVLTLACVYDMGWIRYYLRSDVTFKNLSDPRITVRVSDDAIEFSTCDHTSNYFWHSIRGLWKFRDVWLLFVSHPNFYTVLPTAALSDEVQALITMKVADNGGQVS